MENKRLLFVKPSTAKRHPVVSQYIRHVMTDQNIECFDSALYREQQSYFKSKGYECPVLMEEHNALQQHIRNIRHENRCS
jgi:hypothetical protein